MKILSAPDAATATMESPIPARLFLVKSVENVLSNRLKSGDALTDHLRVFWDDATVELEFTNYQDHWLFEFNRLPGQFFSLSWALSIEEMEMLTLDTRISMGSKILEPQTKRKNPHIDFFGRLTSSKGRKTKKLERLGFKFDSRYQISFNMNERDGNFYQYSYFDANNMWLDYMITRPQFKRWKIGKPQLWFQKTHPF